MCSNPTKIEAQSNNPAHLIYNADSLKADLNDLKEVLYNSHENPFLYIDSLDFEVEFQEHYDSISKDMSLADFSVLVADLLQCMKDSHTTLNYGQLFNFLKEETALNLNFKGLLVQDQFTITKDNEGYLPRGAQLLSINQIDVNSFLDSITAYRFLEGNSFDQSNIILSSLAIRSLSMRYGVKEKNEIIYAFEEDTITVNYPGVPYKKIKTEKRKKTSPYNLTFSNNVAFLDIGSFSAKSEFYYEQFLQSSFRKIKRKKIDSLVVDLRYNLGGSVWRMEELFTYLDGPDVIAPQSISLIKSELSQKKYTTLLKGPFGWARRHLFRNNDKMRGFREMAFLPIGSRDNIIYKTYSKKKKTAFIGEKHLFINYASGSASVLFADIFDRLNFGKTYGSPCLGPYNGTWGDPTPYVLPRSQLNLFISVLRLSTSSEYSNNPESIAPHYYYEPTINDVVSEKDGLKEGFIEGVFK